MESDAPVPLPFPSALFLEALRAADWLDLLVLERSEMSWWLTPGDERGEWLRRAIPFLERFGTLDVLTADDVRVPCEVFIRTLVHLRLGFLAALNAEGDALPDDVARLWRCYLASQKLDPALWMLRDLLARVDTGDPGVLLRAIRHVIAVWVSVETYQLDFTRSDFLIEDEPFSPAVIPSTGRAAVLALLGVTLRAISLPAESSSLHECSNCGSVFVADRRRLRGDSRNRFCGDKCASRHRSREYRARKKESDDGTKG
ncbi:MAG: hypothetical protein ACSLFM_12985 [Tepidiformaceae bacterium]